jgi:hypothetical protein
MVEENGERSYSANTVQGVINSFFVHRGCLASADPRLNLPTRKPRDRARQPIYRSRRLPYLAEPRVGVRSWGT